MRRVVKNSGGRGTNRRVGGVASLLLNDSGESDGDENIPIAAVPVCPPPVPVPSPLCRSPCRVIQSSSDASGNVNVQPSLAARSGALPSSVNTSTGDDQTLPSVNNDVIHSATAKASSRIVTSKTTKNSLNKNKERTSIAGSIVKLIEQQNRPASLVGESATITLMRQMERINRSLDARDRREKKERRKEHKRQKKRCAKKEGKEEGKESKHGRARRPWRKRGRDTRTAQY